MTRPKLGVLARRKLSAARAAIEEDMRVVALQPKSKAPDTRFCPKGADSAVQDIGVVREWLPMVEWQGECELGPEDFLKSSEKVGRPDTELKAAIDFLRSALSDGPRRIKDVMREAEKRSHSSRTIRRAAKMIGVIKVGQKWKLANTPL